MEQTSVKTQAVFQAFICLVCALVLFRFMSPLEATEFAGGTLTGRLLTLSIISIALFLLAMAVTFFSRPIGALAALGGCILGLPLYIYFVAPGPFRSIFKGDYSVPLRASFVWDIWAMVGIFTILLMLIVLVRSLLSLGSSASGNAS